jgi:hypothetical protein
VRAPLRTGRELKTWKAWVALFALALTFAGIGAGSGAAAVASKFAVSTTVVDPSKAAAQSTLSGSVAWTATTSGAEVSRVEFAIDGTTQWTEQNSPYQFNGDPSGLLDTTQLSDGKHKLTVKAYSTDGRSATRKITVRVKNGNGKPSGPPPQQTPPPSTFTVTSSIGSGSTLAGAVAWTASPAGTTVTRLEFQIDGTTRWTEQTAPYQYNGDPNGLLDTTTLSDGTHVVSVIAYAADGRTASASSSIVVANGGVPPVQSPPPPPPPTTPPPTTPPPTTPPPTTPPPALGSIPKYGISVGGEDLYKPTATREMELNEIQTMFNGHPAVVRFDSTPGNQPYVDAFVGQLLAHHLEPMIILFDTTGPLDPKTVGDFAGAQAAKWKGKVRLYELDNEPDLHGWTPEQYTASLKAAYTAIKAADPNAIVIGGALYTWESGPTANPSGGTREWVQRMYAAGAKGYFDMLSLHLYDDPDTHGSWNLWDMAFTMTNNIRSIMNANGDSSVPIISTETGGPTTKYGDAGQATIIDHDFNHLYSGQIAMCLFYTLFDDDVPGFGLLRNDLSRKPAWFTVQNRTK